MSKKAKYFSFAIAIIAVAAVMTIAIYAATAATAGITANVSWTATEGITFELEAWVVNNAAGNGIGATTNPKSISKQIVTASTPNTTAQNLAGDLACSFYDGTDDGVNNPSNIVFTYKIKNTGSGILKVTATKTPTNGAESGTTAANHKPAVALSSKLDSADNTSSCISSITGSGFNIPAGKTLEYIVTLSISNADLSITNYDAGVTFSFGTVTAGTPTIYVNGVQQSSPGIDGATTVGDYLDALDGSQYPGYFYDADLTIYAGEDDIVTNDTKLYTKPATLDKLKFTSNGDGTCDVSAGNGNSINSRKTTTSFTSLIAGYGDDPITTVTLSGEVIIPMVSPLGDIVIGLGYYAFGNGVSIFCEGVTKIVLPGLIKVIENSAFYYCISLASITIPDSVTSIGSNAFDSCTSLTSITIGDGVTSIGERAFFSCYGLTSITIPDGVTSIGSNAFRNCTGLTSITIGDGVISIGSEAFYSCTGLTTVYIPSSVTTITDASSDSPFYGCSSSLKIYCGASSKPSGWRTYWNYYNTSTALSTTWGVTREQYNLQYA